jgi:glutamyl-tRNA synthetase
VKSNGQPLFVLANVVDDIDMAITHVIRGEDLLPTTPKGLLLWGALASSGWQTDGLVAGAPSPNLGLPVFAHLPLLVNAQRKKLSKRRDSVAVESYREQGYLPDAFVNYLALLGWGPPGGEELFNVDQLLSEFRLDHVNHSPAFFDVDKLKHMNGEYIRALPVDAFIDAAQPWLTGPEAPWSPERFDARMFAQMAPLVQERVALLSEVPAMVDFLFVDEPAIDPDSWAKAYGDEVGTSILAAAIPVYESLAAGEGVGWTVDALHQATLAVGERFGRKLGKAQAPIRVAVTGRRVGPPLFDALVVLGPDRVLARLRAAFERLPAPS